MKKVVREVVRNDHTYYLNFSIKDSSGDAVDLSTITSITYKARLHDTTVLLIEGACSVLVADSGTCRYLVLDEDFDTAGIYDDEIFIVFSSGEERTFLFDEKLKIVEDL